MIGWFALERLLQLLPWLASGFVVGLAFFATLGHAFTLYSRGRPAMAGLMYAGRIVLMVGLLVVATRFGAGSLLTATLGILIGRALIIRRDRERLP